MIYHSIGILDDSKIVTIERKLFREIVDLSAARGFFGRLGDAKPRTLRLLKGIKF